MEIDKEKFKHAPIPNQNFVLLELLLDINRKLDNKPDRKPTPLADTCTVCEMDWKYEGCEKSNCPSG